MKIDLEKLATYLTKCGHTRTNIVKDNFDGWTGDIVDYLEDKHSLETKLVKIIKRRWDNGT